VDQVAVALDRACDTLAEARRTVEWVLNGLHGEVSVSSVDHLEEGDLGIASEVNVLGTVSDELHKSTTSHLCLYPLERKNSEEVPEWRKKETFHE